ncbi:hypothetical protein SAMN04488543_3091 [Friedmanniella luteola]|uniref:Htaa protein n=1 Tax=Friedmanniella luteola TaxID=546871 RepID=A0A1H1XSK2_9ACTN|nr:hypothetical protein [Friedmanniella luteola]SDT12228.1 hypothetical protein SAMN04488543_3091 [Friedmanniella luteola]
MPTTTHRRLAIGAAALILVAGAAPAVADDGHHYRQTHARGTLLSAQLIGSLTTDADLAGVAPGGADWSVSRSSVKVKANGRVEVRVRDLVLTSTGANPVTTISASLVCNGKVVDTVGPVAYDTDGDARIRDRFAVPERCLAPAVLLNPADRVGTYIAASGQAG